MNEKEIRAASIVRVQRAMELIETAQNNLASACAELSTLEGAVSPWKACSKLTDKVHKFWYDVKRFRDAGRYRLDRNNIATLEDRKSLREAADAVIRRIRAGDSL